MDINWLNAESVQNSPWSWSPDEQIAWTLAASRLAAGDCTLCLWCPWKHKKKEAVQPEQSACPKNCFESCSNMFSILELHNSVEEFVAKVQVVLSPWKGSIERGNVDLPNRLACNTDCMDCRDCMDCLCSNQLLTTSIINDFINDYHLKSFVPWIALDKSQVLTKTVCMLDVASKHQRRYMKNACQVGTQGRTISVDRSDRSLGGLRGLGVVSKRLS